MPEREEGGAARDWRSPPPPGPRPVRMSLPQAAQTLGAEGAVELAAVRARWAQVVGSQVALHAWPQSFRQGVLSIATDHNAWAAELRSLSAELTKSLQDEGHDVHSIVVMVSHQRPPDW